MLDEDTFIQFMKETDYLGMLSYYDSIFKLFKEGWTDSSFQEGEGEKHRVRERERET